MKKVAILFLILMVMLVSACQPAAKTDLPAETSAPEPTTAPQAKEIIAVCLPALDNPLMLAIQDTFVKGFGNDYDVQVVSADGNPNNQATQVQNFTAMKVKLLVVMAVESSSLVPNLIAARQENILVLVIGGDPGNPDAYDTVMNMNQYLSGWYEAYMAKQWVDKTYPDAADGSVQTAILTSSLNPEAIARSNGMKMIAEPYMKDVNGNYIDANGQVVTEAQKVENPAYSAKVNVALTVDAEMFQAGQTAMQNVLTTNPDVVVVLAYAGDGGMGASQAILDEYAKGAGVSAIEDLNKVAVFGVGMIGAEGPAVLDSATNKTVFRGTIRFGGDLVARTNEVVSKMLSGDIAKVIYDPLDIVTIIDGQIMSVAIGSSEYFTVPTAQPVPVVLRP
jgi:ABC-type sugar transport system substrate-binding protein